MIQQFTRLALVLLSCIILLTACTDTPPRNVNNICAIFRQYPKWYWATQKTKKRWGVPITVQMAIMHQESRFNAKAKPPRRKLLWVIPWFRPSSSYGYSQALRQTWKNYQKSTGKGGADRDAFSDASDFVGWFAYQAHRKAGISRNDSFRLYLAYHEGIGGFQRGSFNKKPWLVKVARKVESKQKVYLAQLRRCAKSLKKKPWYKLW